VTPRSEHEVALWQAIDDLAAARYKPGQVNLVRVEEAVVQIEKALDAVASDRMAARVTDVRFVDRLLFAVFNCHDGSELWAHAKRDPDTFRRTVTYVMVGAYAGSWDDRPIEDPVDAMLETLADHWLAGIDCDHEAKTDTPRCACCSLAFPAYPNVGAAVRAWLAHVAEVHRSRP
jgi:hypothetical protein